MPLRKLQAQDIKRMFNLVWESVERKAKKEQRNILQNVKCFAMPDSCLVKVEFSHSYGENKYLKENEDEDFASTVQLFIEEMKRYTDDFTYIDSYIKHYGYIIFRPSKDIQVIK